MAFEDIIMDYNDYLENVERTKPVFLEIEL